MRLLLILAGIAYALIPFDLLPDVFLGPGWIDDIIVIGAIWWYLGQTGKRPKAGRTGGQRESAHAGSSGNQGAIKSPYEVLGLGQTASQEDIKKAYRNLAGQYHPDKVSHLGKEFQDLAEARFKEIQQAYDELRVK
jgi:hypothetical protein